MNLLDFKAKKKLTCLQVVRSVVWHAGLCLQEENRKERNKTHLVLENRKLKLTSKLYENITERLLNAS